MTIFADPCSGGTWLRRGLHRDTHHLLRRKHPEDETLPAVIAAREHFNAPRY
jgi:hypothetical protein